MKKITHLASKQWLMLFFLPLVSLAQVKQEWVTTYNATGEFSPDNATALKVSKQGNIYVTGTTSRKNKGLDYTTIKYDAAGNVAWTKHYNGALNGNDYATAMWVDDKENVYVTGYSAAGEVVSNYDYATVKYDKDGNLKWVKRYGGGGYDQPTAITADAIGNVYVTGYRWESEFNEADYATIKYDKDGNQLWAKLFDGEWNDRDYATAIAVDKNFHVYVAGRSLNTDNNYDYAIVSYKPNGEEQWVAIYNGPANADDEANDIKVDALSNVYVTGASSNGNNYEFATVKYNRDGVQQWVHRYAKEFTYTIAKLLMLDEKGNVYVAGESAGFTTVKYNKDGVLQWAADDFGDDNYVDSVTGLAIDNIGNVYVTGSYGDEYAQTSIGVVKYDPAGNKLWEKRIGNGIGIPEWERSRDLSLDIDVDAKGNVYIVGAFDDSATLSNLVTIKFNSNGEQQWLKQVTGTSNGNEVLKGMAVDKMGNVYVTGTTDANDPKLDIVTNKYDNAGNKVWSKRIGFKDGAENVAAIAADAMGNVFITGSVQQRNTGTQFLTAKYNTGGELLWTMRYSEENPSVNYALEMALDALGNVYVTGISDNGQGGPSFTTIKYNTHGIQQWAASYSFNLFYGQKPTGITTDAAGNVFVTGTTHNGSNLDFITIKYNLAGIQQWFKTYNGPDNSDDIPASIEADAAGNVYVAGASAGYVTIKYNAAGNELWVARPPVDSKRSAATDLAIDNAGNVFVTGNLYPAAGIFPRFIKVGTIKYNAAGIQQWMKVYEGEGIYFDDDVLSTANEIALDKQGNIYVSVNDSLQNDGDHETSLIRINRFLVTIKYDGAGNELWLEKLLVRSMDTVSFIGLDDANNVYVSGMQDGYGTNKDFVIARYSQMEMITRNTNTENNLLVDVNSLTANAFPNPFNQNFTLRWSGQNLPVNIMMTDATGKLLDRKTNLAGSGNLQAGSNFPSGLYFIKLFQGKEQVVLKVIKN